MDSNLLLTLTLLTASVVLQLVAAILALRAMRYSGRHRYPWIALFLALALMVLRRVAPLQDVLSGIPQDFLYTLFGLMISALMAFSMMGLSQLLRGLRDNEERLTRLATTDTLTGLANRRQVLAILEAELRRARRTGHPLALLMLDLDHFKNVNDRYGHAIGDAVLVTTAARCQAQLRGMDTCGRVGGEEFLVVLPETGIEEARGIAERLRASLGETPIDTGAESIPITISIGLAHFMPVDNADRSNGEQAQAQMEALLRQADEALYRAKSDGRDRVRQ